MTILTKDKMHEPITYFINNLLSGMRNALPGQPGSAPHLPDNHRLKSILKWIKKFGLNTAVIQIPKINQYQSVRLVNALVKNLNFNQAIHSSKTNPRLIPLLLPRKNRKFKSFSNPFYYSRSTLTPELR